MTTDLQFLRLTGKSFHIFGPTVLKPLSENVLFLLKWTTQQPTYDSDDLEGRIHVCQ